MKKHAVCIGINDYPGTGSDLSGCVNDANDWSSELKDRGFDVKLLLDQQATKQKMLDEIHGVIKQAKGGDLVVVTYSGHGTFIADEDGEESDYTDECLCPHDITTNGPITDDELYQKLCPDTPDVKVVFISDSCHSGTVSKFAPILTPPSIKANGIHPPQRKVRFLPPAAFLPPAEAKSLSQKTNWSSGRRRYTSLLMSGCMDPEYSYDAWFNGRANGAFTFVALSTLKSLPLNATYKEWHKAIRKVLPSQQYPQRPNLYASAVMKTWSVLA
jgi:metacaspase-1